jgi:hypothetical protein
MRLINRDTLTKEPLGPPAVDRASIPSSVFAYTNRLFSGRRFGFIFSVSMGNIFQLNGTMRITIRIARTGTTKANH